MRCLLLRFGVLLFLIISGCNVRDYSGEFTDVPVSVGSLSAEVVPQPSPNSYKVKLSWTGLNPPLALIYRRESSGSVVAIGRGAAGEGTFYDEDVLAGKTYEYSFSSASETGVRTSVEIPVDFVAGAADVTWFSGVIKGYRRLFLSQLVTSGPIDIDVDEIILWQPATGGVPLISTSPPYDINAGIKRLDAYDVQIKARRLSGMPVLAIGVSGKSGGKADAVGGRSGSVQIKITEETPVVVSVVSGRARRADDLDKVEVSKTRLAPLGAIDFAHGDKLFRFNEKFYPLPHTGVYQHHPALFISTDGYVHTIALDEGVEPAVFRHQSRFYLYERFVISSDQNLLVAPLRKPQRPLVKEVLNGPWLDLYLINERLADIYKGLEFKIEIEVDLPEVFSADLSSRVAHLHDMVESIADLKNYVRSNNVHKLIYSFAEGASEFANGVITIRSEELRLDD